MILYGGLAKDEYEPRTSDVNVMVVLKEVTVEVLDKVASPVQEGLRAFRLAVMVLSENDLRRSTDVFPIKFLDMQKYHRLRASGHPFHQVIQNPAVRCDQYRRRQVVCKHDMGPGGHPFGNHVPGIIRCPVRGGNVQGFHAFIPLECLHHFLLPHFLRLHTARNLPVFFIQILGHLQENPRMEIGGLLFPGNTVFGNLRPDLFADLCHRRIAKKGNGVPVRPEK